MDLSKLRTVREAKGMTQGDLAKRAGVAQATLSRHETGKRAASIEAVRRYAKALGMSKRWHALVGD